MGIPKRLSFIKRPKVVVPLVLITLLVIAAVILVKNLNAPAEGTVNQTPPSKAETIDPYANPGQYKGQYINFSYPAHYRIVPTQRTGTYLEVVGLYSTNQTSKQISVGVLKESLADDSGIKLRRAEAGKYTEAPRNASGIVLFTSTTNGSERTAYVSHQDKVATFSITALPGWDLTEDMETMLNSLKWK